MTKHCADELLQASNFGQSSSSGVNSADKCEAKLSSREKNIFPLLVGFSGCGGRSGNDYLGAASAGPDCWPEKS